MFAQLYIDLTAKGKKTPLAYATAQAKTDLEGWGGERRIIIISDGMDTCNEDPLPLADELGAAGIELDVIGLGEAGDLGQLAEMALLAVLNFNWQAVMRPSQGQLAICCRACQVCQQVSLWAQATEQEAAPPELAQELGWGLGPVQGLDRAQDRGNKLDQQACP